MYAQDVGRSFPGAEQGLEFRRGRESLGPFKDHTVDTFACVMLNVWVDWEAANQSSHQFPVRGQIVQKLSHSSPRAVCDVGLYT